MANELPFRYRGYFYDTETGFYYLNARYYDPQIKRFINADEVNIINATPNALTDKNLYAYCDNNPVVREDQDGEFWLKALRGAAKGVVKQAVSDIVTYVTTGNVDTSASKYVGAAVGFGVGYMIDETGDKIIEWAISWFN